MAEEERIPTTLRTLLILETLGKSDHPMTATEINAHLGLPKQSIHRLCTSLESDGFLTRLGDSRKYVPSRRMRELGSGLLFNSRNHIARRQILMDVAKEVRETVNFVVPEDAGMSYVDRVETDWAFQIQLPIGTHVPFHCTASGKCFLASLKPGARIRFVHALDLTGLTRATKTDVDVLIEDLDAINERGYSLDEEEFLDGMVAIAVPVTDADGRYVASLAFHGPTQRLKITDAIAKKGVLQEAALKLRSALFD